MDRLETLKELKQMADNKDFALFEYIEEGINHNSRCVIGHLLYRTGKSDEYLRELTGDVVELLDEGCINTEELPFSDEELIALQAYNDHFTPGMPDTTATLSDYIQSLIDKERVDNK